MAGSSEITNLQNFVADPLRTIVAHLAKNSLTAGQDEFALSALQECDFPGYAPIPLTTWHLDPSSDDAVARMVADQCQWVAGAIVTPQTATLVYITMAYNGGAPVLWRQFQLLPQTRLTTAGQTIDQVVDLISSDP